jgi:hypothetical protein
MAEKIDNTKPDGPEYATERPGVSKEDLHKEMLQRHKECQDYWLNEYREARQDMEFAFVPDKQWDEWMLTSRKGRPMYTVNKLRQAMKQITNDQRQNRPQAKVRPTGGDSEELAEVRQGLIRNIDAQLDAQRAVDTAFQFAVGGGFGVWRLTTSYQDDGGFDQVIQREEIQNPYSVTFDPAAKKKDRRDARFAFIDTDWARGAFRARWPKAKLVSVASTTDMTRDWWGEREVRVAEYWYKTTETVQIVLMSDGSVYDADEVSLILDELAAAGVTEQRRRYVEREKVWHCIVSGAEILEGPNEWPGRFIPIVPVWGEILNLEGRDKFFGAVRFAKDPQKMLNYQASTLIEYVGDQPYSPFIGAASAVEGYEAAWQSMRTSRAPLLLYNDKDGNGQPIAPPQRQSPPAFPAALANLVGMSSDDIKATTGIYDASLGARSNETSGRAILARQREGDVANFDYMDNLAYALKYDFEITNDLITAVYDTERQVRILGEDGAEKVVAVNQSVIDEQTGQEIVLNDMSQGRFDITVSVGPSYTTQRMEAAEALMQLSNDPSPLGMVSKYGFIKSLDTPGLEDVQKAARKLLVGQGLLDPEEGEQPPPPPQPNPEDIAGAEKDAAMAAKYGAEAQGQQIENAVNAALARMQFGPMLAPMQGPPPPMGPPAQPIPFGPMPMPQQPPPGGSFSPEQGPAPGGLPGLPLQ